MKATTIEAMRVAREVDDLPPFVLDMYADTRVDMRAGMSGDMSVGMHVIMCVNKCVETHVYMCARLEIYRLRRPE